MSYTTLSKLYFGISVEKDSTFDIIEKKKVEFETNVNEKTSVKLNNYCI